MSLNELELREAAENSDTSIERAFERGVDAAFKILGYETKLMGQGKGRVPDGEARSSEDSYVLLWDSKVREKGYSMGTDDRAIKEYITTQTRLEKRKGLHTYYAIISSKFVDDFEDMVRSLKMETHISEVVLIEAEALVTMVDLRLREPQAVTLGPNGIQRLLSDGGIVTANDVKALFE